MQTSPIPSGMPELDEVLQGLQLGDNVVWQVDDLDEYVDFARPFVRQAVHDGRTCVYIRFAPHAPVLAPDPHVEVVEVDPSKGFDVFCSQIHRIIREKGRGVFYVMDNLSVLVEEWATDEQLANFFQVTCPYLYELDTITYFALLRGAHDFNAVARIRETTQLLIDVYRVNEELYIHPLKVYRRYSPTMFLPHSRSDDGWVPVLQSGEAAAVAGRARKHPLGSSADSTAPWDSVYRKLIEYERSGGTSPEADPEISALKQEFTRMLFGNHPEFNRLAYEFLTLKDLFAVRNRIVGSGRIGGKAAGMLLARSILLSGADGPDFKAVLEDHDSFFIGSDVFFTFLVNNDLFRLRLELSRDPDFSREDFEEVEARFLAGSMPHETVQHLREMLDYFGQAPVIVRSSSLLEDSIGNAFAGKYRSEFCPNQGPPEERLTALLRAIKLVYASALNPDALSYRRRRGLRDSDEQMAILIQRVSGMPYRRYFFPSLAGVAFSRNLYAWNDRIDPQQGVIRLVFGLGTRAVNRVGGDYPRLIAVSHPGLRPEVGMKVAKYSQWNVDVIDLESNELLTLPAGELLDAGDYPNIHLLASIMSDGYVQDPATSFADFSGSNVVLTFNNLIKRTDFVDILKRMLSKLDATYGHPVDTEFTAFISPEGKVRVNLLQCRPMWLPGDRTRVEVPQDIDARRTLFRTNRLINGGEIDGIRYVVAIDPRQYARTEATAKHSVGRIVGRLNRHPAMVAGKMIMMGPGRWGSSNIDLGVNVGYADIDNTSALVEIAYEEAGHAPEVSYGTHFFLDLVEAEIIYLAVYPDDEQAAFNSEFIANSPNVLAELVPSSADFSDLIRVIDVPATANGAGVRVVADAHSRRAICYIG